MLSELGGNQQEVGPLSAGIDRRFDRELMMMRRVGFSMQAEQCGSQQGKKKTVPASRSFCKVGLNSDPPF